MALLHNILKRPIPTQITAILPRVIRPILSHRILLRLIKSLDLIINFRLVLILNFENEVVFVRLGRREARIGRRLPVVSLRIVKVLRLVRGHVELGVSVVHHARTVALDALEVH